MSKIYFQFLTKAMTGVLSTRISSLKVSRSWDDSFGSEGSVLPYLFLPSVNTFILPLVDGPPEDT